MRALCRAYAAFLAAPFDGTLGGAGGLGFEPEHAQAVAILTVAELFGAAPEVAEDEAEAEAEGEAEREHAGAAASSAPPIARAAAAHSPATPALLGKREAGPDAGAASGAADAAAAAAGAGAGAGADAGAGEAGAKRARVEGGAAQGVVGVATS